MASGLRYGLEVRRAVAADAPDAARLLLQAGVSLTAEAVAERLEAFRARPEAAVIVTTGYGGLSGLAALHWAPELQQPRPVAHVTMLVVDADERRHGIGRLLLKSASQAARSAGCDTLELAGDGQGALAAFCLATGFVQTGTAFTRSLRKRGTDG